jgi:dinuclear metal center YbgI/SA1388 family protein
MKLESLLQYMDEYLALQGHPDYTGALNGLQVEGPSDVAHLVAAVDASEASISAAVAAGADLMIVHHGLFWGGLQPLTGRHYRKVRALIEGGTALYSAHLPLDGHAEVGNSALLGRALGLESRGRFGDYGGVEIGWWGELSESTGIDGLKAAFEAVVGGPVHVIAGGPERIQRVGVVTGGGASFIGAAIESGLDALVTGEGSHHSHFDAMELGLNVLMGGHYATETFGVRALAEQLAERFGLSWEFIDQPTGL